MSEEAEYDVFLSYGEADKDAVEKIAYILREKGLEIYLDRWHLVPGKLWQDDIEKALDASHACAVFLGPSGLGSWDHVQMRAALRLRVEKKDYGVIPVLLPGADWPERGKLPLFLTLYKWVDFRPGLDDAQAQHELVCGVKGIAPGPLVSPDPAICPFRGLEVFEEEHAQFFFGREALIQHLVERLRRDRFLAVTSPSGGGKSSLVRAGLIPQVRQGRLDGSQHWAILLFKPGPHPLEMLAARLIPDSVDADRRLAAQKSYLAELRKDEGGLHRIMQTRLSGAPDTRRLLVVVDQFEEVFTLCSDEGARTSFIDNLLHASGIAGGQTIAVVTMRADFFGMCAVYPTLAARLSERNVLVGPMQPAELRRVIEEPAHLVKLEYEKGLVDTILSDLGDAPGRLPLLQHTLWMLWQEGRRGAWLTIDKYHEISGVQGALTKWADEVYGKLTSDQQEMTRQILLRLTQPGEGTEDTRRRTRLTELIPDGPGAAQVARTIQVLTDAHLLTTGKNERDERVVEVAHEALIRHWPRLRTWIDDSRARLLLQRRLTDAANEWDRNGRETSYLYRGPRLIEVEDKLTAAGLSTLEREFVQASVEFRKAEQQAHRRRLLTRIGTVGLVISLLAVIGLIIWQIRSPWNKTFADDQVWALAATNEMPPTYYLGTKDSGLRRSTDGVTWTTLQEGLPIGVGEPGRNIPAVERMAIDGQDPNRLFAFMSRHGVYRSLNGGDTWKLAGTGVLTTSDIIDLAVWGDLVLAVSDAFDGRGLYVSQNDGQDWHLVGGKGNTLFDKVYAVHIDSHGDYIYVGAETGFYRLATLEPIIDTSVWQEIDDLPPVISIESAKGRDEIFYLVTFNPEGIGSIYRWQPDSQEAEWLTDVSDQPNVLAPHPNQTGQTLAYILFINNRVSALKRTGELESLGRGPSGIGLALLIGSHPKESKYWLLLGHEEGLYEYIDELD